MPTASTTPSLAQAARHGTARGGRREWGEAAASFTPYVPTAADSARRPLPAGEGA